MAWIHHPLLDVDVEVPDDLVEHWCGEPGWRPGTRENPEPFTPPHEIEPDGMSVEPVEQSASDLPTVPDGDAPTKARKV